MTLGLRACIALRLRCEAKWTSENGLRACQRHLLSIRFARYSARELAATREGLLFDTTGNLKTRFGELA